MFGHQRFHNVTVVIAKPGEQCACVQLSISGEEIHVLIAAMFPGLAKLSASYYQLWAHSTFDQCGRRKRASVCMLTGALQQSSLEDNQPVKPEVEDKEPQQQPNAEQEKVGDVVQGQQQEQVQEQLNAARPQDRRNVQQLLLEPEVIKIGASRFVRRMPFNMHMAQLCGIREHMQFAVMFKAWMCPAEPYDYLS
jgi:hypothetical protein